MEQLTLDFEYLINEVIRRDAEWAPQFCSVSDYDVVILEVSVHSRTHTGNIVKSIAVADSVGVIV